MTWFFPLSNGGEEQGLNESGVQQFKRPESLGRETCQNIGDVRSSSDKPAIAEFDLIDLPTDEFPGIESFYRYFTSCKNYVLKGLPNGTGNEKGFFEKGLDLLDKPSIPVLRIGDFNTTGLVGSDIDRTSPFFRLIKQQGSSSPQGVGGGTFGIGQRAPFAHSALRTVLYSTKTEDGSLAFIAKSILASFPHPDHDQNITQAKGWWCIPSEDKTSWSTFRNRDEIPERFRRLEVGTDLWITGFDSNNWERVIRHSILEHFFAAIHNQQLEVRLLENGSLLRKINNNNLENELLVAAEESRTLNTKAQHLKGLGSTLYFHKAISQPYDGSPFETFIEKLGKVKFFLYRDASNNDLPERWATMRLPRIIVESKGSSLLSNFAGVFVCESVEGNSYLAQLEGPTHEYWSEKEARNWSEVQIEEAKTVLREITRFVRRILKEVRGKNMQDQEEIPNLGHYLPAEEDFDSESIGGYIISGNPTDKETGEKRSRDSALIINPTKKPQVNRLKNPSTLDDRKEKPIKGETGKKKTDTRKDKSHTKNDSDNKPASLTKDNLRFRSYKAQNYYKIIIQSNTDITGNLKLRAIGEGKAFPVEIISASDSLTKKSLTVSKDTIKNIELKSNKKRQFDITIDSKTDLCLSVGD